MRKIRSHRQQGFTLTELMIVIAIVALLATIAVPTWGPSMNGAEHWYRR